MVQWVKLDPETGRWFVHHVQAFTCSCGHSFEPPLTFVDGTFVPTDIPIHCPDCFALVGTVNTAPDAERCPACHMPIGSRKPPPTVEIPYEHLINVRITEAWMRAERAARAPLAVVKAWIAHIRARRRP